MSKLDVQPLREDLEFGARIRGVTAALLHDAPVRGQLAELFEKEGVLLFEEVEPTSAMQVALSSIAGPLKDHVQKTVKRVDQNAAPGLIDMLSEPEDKNAIEVDGKLLASWRPWHFDHCYNNELNRGGVLRAIEIAPEGGMTGFLDGISLYRAFSPELRARIEDKNIVYRFNILMENYRFGRPSVYHVRGERASSSRTMEEMAPYPRGIHPAVWTRKTGERVLHVSPWMAEGIEGAENDEGDQLLEAVCREIFATARDRAYFHKWRPTDMVLWDNWRALHAVSGHPPQYRRRMHRTTIKGDYGLGYFEGVGKADEAAEMTA